jgi:hypothetical protein
VQEHGRKLIALFGLPEDTDPQALYYALHRIEARAHTYSERACNDEHFDTSEEADAKRDASILSAVDRILHHVGKGIPVIVSGDPRGYALKIPNDVMRDRAIDLHTDWGGYGIICPDFDR